MKQNSRIEKVGAALRRQRSAETLIVSQDVSNPDQYHGVGGLVYTTADLERIAETKQVVRITYTDHAPIPGEKVVTFDDAFGNLITSDDAGEPHNPIHDAGDK